MKAGDLVQLSSYGANRQHNMDCYGGWGIVIEVLRPCHQYPIKTHWYKTNGKELSAMCFHPRELKRFKADK